MGNDGGSIPKRRELVREAARGPNSTQMKETLRESQEHAWTTCPLSHKVLARPIVSDSAGILYNKESILEFLIPGDDKEGISSKSDCEEITSGRIKSLRDVVELQFEVDTRRKEHPSELLNAHRHIHREGWVCPVTSKALGPSVKSVYLVPCGHVFSEESFRLVKEDKCVQCDAPFDENNVILILPTKEEDKARLAARSKKLADQGLTHSLKKAPGSKKRKKALMNSDTPGETTQTKASVSASGNGIKNAATSLITARVLEEQNKKRRKMGARNENIDSLFTKDSEGMKDGDFMTRGFTIPASARR